MIIAISGGICSGKSEVSAILTRLGEKVISADQINNELLQEPSYMIEVAKLFPDAIECGNLNRQKLRNIIFNDKNARVRLNALAHPAIMNEIFRRAKEVNGRVFVEIPLLIESGTQQRFDAIWYVTADDEIRIARLKTRNNISRDSAVKILEAQKNEATALKIADLVIYNNGTKEELQNFIKQNLK